MLRSRHIAHLLEKSGLDAQPAETNPTVLPQMSSPAANDLQNNQGYDTSMASTNWISPDGMLVTKEPRNTPSRMRPSAMASPAGDVSQGPNSNPYSGHAAYDEALKSKRRRRVRSLLKHRRHLRTARMVAQDGLKIYHVIYHSGMPLLVHEDAPRPISAPASAPAPTPGVTNSSTRAHKIKRLVKYGVAGAAVAGAAFALHKNPELLHHAKEVGKGFIGYSDAPAAKTAPAPAAPSPSSGGGESWGAKAQTLLAKYTDSKPSLTNRVKDQALEKTQSVLNRTMGGA